MKNRIFGKGLVFGIIVLFFGAGIMPGIDGTFVKNQNLKDNKTPLMNFNTIGNSLHVNCESEETKASGSASLNENNKDCRNKDNSIFSSLEEDSENNDPQPKVDILIGPYMYVWIKANLSTKEFGYIYYKDNQPIGIYIEFLAEDANDDSYFTYNSLLSPFKGIIFDHKENNRYNYFWIQFDIIFKKNIKYSNDRILITFTGLFGMIVWTSLGIPVHDTSKPTAPAIIGSFQGKPNVEYEYTFFSRSYNEYDLFYYIDWGDGNSTGWIGPYESCKAFALTHLWDTEGIYEIRAQSKDVFGTQSTLNYILVRISKKPSEEIYGAKSLQAKPKVTMSKNLQQNSQQINSQQSSQQSQNSPSNQQSNQLLQNLILRQQTTR